MADALRVDDDVVLLAVLSVIDDIIDDFLFVVVILFRKQNIFGAVGDAAPQSDISRVSAHNFDDAAALMRRRSIPHLINRLHCRIDGGVKADCIICAGNVQIDGSGDADRVDTMSGKCECAAV